VIGEAMAAGVPVVTTDVGDCARLVGDTGRVVPARDVEALAEAVLGVLVLPGAR
jgi:glycosyltransferase involved in cell wall biosynthesis